MTKSTVPTERLKEIKALAENIEAGNGLFNAAEIELLTTELLAVREAQSVEVTDEMAMAFHRALTDSDIGSDDLDDIKIGLRGALCNFAAPPAPAVPDFGALTKLIVGRLIDCGTASDDSIADAEVFVYNACRAAMLQAGNSPVTPDGWKLVPVESTEDMIAAAMMCDDVQFNSDETFCVNFGNIFSAMLAAAPTPTK